jgi:hypothetical protein
MGMEVVVRKPPGKYIFVGCQKTVISILYAIRYWRFNGFFTISKIMVCTDTVNHSVN